jgi:hypothetical protein
VCLLTFQSLEGLTQVETPLKHLFEPGVYIREMRVPAGTLLTGREHLLGHRVELCHGSAILFAPDGKFRFDAPAHMESKPGFHAVAYMLTDVVARTVHPNPEEARDIEALESKWFGSGAEVIERGRVLSQSLRELSCQQP